MIHKNHVAVALQRLYIVHTSAAHNFNRRLRQRRNIHAEILCSRAEHRVRTRSKPLRNDAVINRPRQASFHFAETLTKQSQLLIAHRTYNSCLLAAGRRRICCTAQPFFLCDQPVHGRHQVIALLFLKGFLLLQVLYIFFQLLR